MAYPPSSTVSYFNQICFISNLNDWLIVDGVFFDIRCIILLSNKTEKLKQVVYLFFFQSGVQSNEACTDLQIVDPSEMTTPKMHCDQNDTGLDLHATYIILSFAQIQPVEMYVRIKQNDNSP